MTFHFRSRFWRDLFLCPDCGTTSAFPLRWTVLLFHPPPGCYVFVHVLLHSLSLHLTRSFFISLHSLSLSLSPSLSLFSSFSPPISTVSLATSPLPLALWHACVRNRRRGKFFFLLLSSSREGEIDSPSLTIFLSYSLLSVTLSFSSSLSSLHARLFLSLATEISVARREFFFSLLLFFLSLSPSLPHFLPRLRVSLSLSLSTEISVARSDGIIHSLRGWGRVLSLIGRCRGAS